LALQFQFWSKVISIRERYFEFAWDTDTCKNFKFFSIKNSYSWRYSNWKKTGDGLFGISFKIKGPTNNLKTTVNPVKTLTPRFITRMLEEYKKKEAR